MNKKQQRLQAKAVKAGQVAAHEGAAERASDVPNAKSAVAVVAAAPRVFAKLPSMPKSRKPKAPKSCECGCGSMTRGGRFVPGHDARLHGWVLRVERKVVSIAQVRDTDGKGVALAVFRAIQAKAQVAA